MDELFDVCENYPEMGPLRSLAFIAASAAALCVLTTTILAGPPLVILLLLKLIATL